MIMWSRNRLPSFSVNVPGDQVTFEEGAVSIRVL
jgi:hypothetical protein